MSNRVFSGLILAGSLGFALACSGMGGAADNVGGGKAESLAHSTWEANGGQYRLQLKGGDDAVYTWRGMSGPAVSGSWRQSGDELRINWEAADHMGNREFRMERVSPCALALTWRKDKKGKGHDMSTIYERTKPRCIDVD